MKKKKTNVEIARDIVCGYLESLASKDMISFEGLKEAMAIKFDKTNMVLLEHIKALKNIFEKAIIEIELTEIKEKQNELRDTQDRQ